MHRELCDLFKSLELRSAKQRIDAFIGGAFVGTVITLLAVCLASY